jgi:Na+-translocating ferredoxin:NAD+ oxidoreductase RNF subunit RnfB
MDTTGIIIATVIVGGVGVLIGVLLGIAANVFHVAVDEKEAKIRDLLPGNNCGGCAMRVVMLWRKLFHREKKRLQPVRRGPEVAETIAKIMGSEVNVCETGSVCKMCRQL